ncbi:MAG: peptidoglycan DD-metalloendopeptidase family protein [Patescibacteria group bacterium]|nr:peptidoglycan DD-metalloendopeptidase family protein [Patescibacteria group bacterium]
MFPLKQRKIGGYKFAQRTWYSSRHLGVDYVASKGTPLYAPFDGEILKRFYGFEGGNTIWFKPNGQNVIIRFLHLSSFNASGKVKSGQVIGYTGNSGSLTKGAHLHLDISKGAVNIWNFANFLDPDKFDWKDIAPVPASNNAPSVPPASSKIEQWALAIKKHEGFIAPCAQYPKGSRAYRNNNPGNLRYTSYSASLGLIKGKDDKNFVIYQTYDIGFNALKKFLTDAANGKLISYKPDMTLYQFYSKYAPSTDGNYPKGYAESVAWVMGVSPNTKIKDLL